MKSAENPYSSPLGGGRSLVDDPDGPLRQGDFRNVFLAWERLRIFFNVVLGFPSTLYLISRAATGGLGFAQIAFFAKGAIVANVCFCVAPVIEGYLTWLTGRSARIVRWFLFPIGTLAALWMASGALIWFADHQALLEGLRDIPPAEMAD